MRRNNDVPFGLNLFRPNAVVFIIILATRSPCLRDVVWGEMENPSITTTGCSRVSAAALRFRLSLLGSEAEPFLQSESLHWLRSRLCSRILPLHIPCIGCGVARRRHLVIN